MKSSQTIQRALISTHDKTDIVRLSRVLVSYGIEIIATGGTARLLTKNSIPLTEISDYTGYPELMDGRVKTLHPRIHAGILARRGQDEPILTEHNIPPIDLVIINLYPFAEVSAKENTTLKDAIENIDIGGPTLLRAAAKNYHAVTAISNPNQYDTLINELKENNGATSLDFRATLAQSVFANIANYNQLIAQYLQQINSTDKPNTTTLPNHTEKNLRYGENPQQQASVYSNNACKTRNIANAPPLQGKILSYNNLADADAAWMAVSAFPRDIASCVIVKHATPCGVASADNLLSAYQKAYQTDPSSAFGGIIACNQILDKNTATAIIEQQFVEVILAPNFSQDAIQILKKKQNIRLLALDPISETTDCWRSIYGGMLKQNDLPADPCTNHNEWEVVTSKQPCDKTWQDLIFAWRVVKNVKSNAIVYANCQQTLGIGCGQTSRVFAAEIAALKANAAKLDLHNSVVASDAFFPFADGLEIAAAAGVRAVIQPGGSKRDQEVIAAAEKHQLVMVFTKQRLFKH